MLAELLLTGTSLTDSVVPILFALVVLILGAVIGGRLMTSLKQLRFTFGSNLVRT